MDAKVRTDVRLLHESTLFGAFVDVLSVKLIILDEMLRCVCGSFWSAVMDNGSVRGAEVAKHLVVLSSVGMR